MDDATDGPAILRRASGPVTGRLRVDGRWLRFEPAGASGERGSVALHITDIKRLHRAWARVGGLPILPTSLTVEMRNGERHTFSVRGRSRWVRAIEGVYDETPGR